MCVAPLYIRSSFQLIYYYYYMHNIARTEIQLNPRSEGGYDVLSTPNKPRGALRPPPHSPGYMSILYNNLKTVHHSNRHRSDTRGEI